MIENERPDALRELFDLTGKTVLITGGTSTVGLALARGLGAAGASIAIMSRRQERAERAVALLTAEGIRAIGVEGDVLSESQCQDAVAVTAGKLGSLDVLVTAAEIHRRYPAEGFPAEVFAKIQETNVNGTYLICKSAFPAMIKQGQGRIITLSSSRAQLGHTLGFSAYAASKGAVNALTHQLAAEWAKYNILVNSISYSLVLTPSTQNIYTDPEGSGIFTEHIAMGRAALPEELVGTAVYLASKASSFVTGEILHVHGGVLGG